MQGATLTMAMEEHKSCVCVDPESIDIRLDQHNVDVRLRQELEVREEEKLSREIRSVAPTISNAISTTRATSAVKTGGTAVSASQATMNGEFGPPKPTEHEIVYYKTCLACREQQDACKVLKKYLIISLYLLSFQKIIQDVDR